MHVLGSFIVTLTLAQGVQAPVLEFPEAGLDDPEAYEGYTTRFFRDSERNSFQVYVRSESGRVVHVWADATNASASFTVRDLQGQPAQLRWGGPGAEASSDGNRRTMRHRLATDLTGVEIGWFVLGTMRQERDFQYWRWHERPYGEERFALDELTALIASVDLLPADERGRHLALLNASDASELRSRLHPRATLTEDDRTWTAVIEQMSLDGKNRMTIEVSGDLQESTPRLEDDVLRVRSRNSGGIWFDVATTSDAPTLTPLARDEIFNDEFDAFYARQQDVADSVRRALPSVDAERDSRVTSFRRLERAVRGMELLSSREKFMAALPNYATYFGRDQIMSVLMLEPIITVDVQEYLIANVLEKVGPSGDVSHEEALGGQAIREGANEYNAHIRAWEETRGTEAAAADEHLAQARDVLVDLQTVRENYRMIDDDFQFAVLVDRYLGRSDVPAARKRQFLSEPVANGGSRLDVLVRNLALVAEWARPYAEDATTTNLVGFRYRDDDGWLPGSWRDSRVGYGNGQFAMDVNVVWVPNALEATERIVQTLNALGLSAEDALSRTSKDASALENYLHDPATLSAAINTWRGARRHFEVRLDGNEVRTRVDALLVSMPGEEQEYWRRLLEDDRAIRPLSFLALSLDSLGQLIPAANTDPATDLFLENYTQQILGGSADPAAVTEMLDVFQRPYPVGLFVAGVGPVVVNDAYASAAVQQRFREDLYHSPRVVWGREVNLLLLGLARQIEAAYDASGGLRDDSEAMRSYVEALRRALEVTRQAVEASGMRHNELWSYRIDDGTLRPVRYGTSSDIQLWNLTDLAVRFQLDRLPPQ